MLSRQFSMTPMGLTRLSLLTSLLLVGVCGCSTLAITQPESPTVSVTRVVPQNLSLTKSKLNFTLRVNNPNAFDLPVETLDFVAFFSGDKIASGNTYEQVTIPANSEADIDVEVVARLSKLWDQLKTMFNEDQSNLKYTVTGSVKLANWPTRIPFNVERSLENPTKE